MIPHDYITAWRAQAPWVQDFQVEKEMRKDLRCRSFLNNPTHPASPPRPFISRSRLLRHETILATTVMTITTTTMENSTLQNWTR